MVTCVHSCHGLGPTMSPGPSAPVRFPMKIVKGSTWASISVATLDLRLERRLHHPVRLRRGLVHELISVKLIF
jgi:hypothetical protein